MASTIINVVKQNKLLYNAYYYVGNALVRLLKFFLHADPKLIVFNSFGGRRYDDSPKAIYLSMLDDQRFADYRFVWAFVEPDKYSIPRGETIKVDTFSYYKTVLKARVWITNTTMTRALSFKGIKTFYLNTWHGSAIKRIGCDAIGDKTFVSKGSNNTDLYLAQGEYDRRIFSHAFGISPELVKVTGLPRNDELASPDVQSKAYDIKQRLSIPSEKQVILYAPTFREYVKDGTNYALDLPINLSKWKDELGDKYVLLMRAHPAVATLMNIKDNGFVKDVSTYPQLNDLMIVSDVLISDYSSIFFDYSILARPMFCFAYDYNIYQKERGMYFDIRKDLGDEMIDSEGKLLFAIINMNETKRVEASRRFRDKYVEKYGTATREIVELIVKEIQ